jgi:uncharacterized protein
MEDPWFKDGLRFKCTNCGKCCKGRNGYVFLSPQDLSTLARRLELSDEEFKKLYTRIVDGQICLIDAPSSDACIFLKENKCSVYESRPIQCAAFPWWLNTIQNPDHWRLAAIDCEGIDHSDAPLISGPEIACECMKYYDNLIEMNSAFDYH